MALPVYTVHLGSKGQIVRWIQEALHLTADGTWGPGTDAAVKAFQASHGLTSDGVAGPKTLSALGIQVHLGLDVSHYPGTIDWVAVKAAGIYRVVVKVTQGNTGDDDTGPKNIKGALQAGLNDLLVYHFAVPDNRANDALQEAANAVQHAMGRTVVLDLEQTNGLGSVALGDWTGTFLREVERLSGKTPWLYTTGDYLKNRISQEDLSKYPKWIARYWGRDDDPDAPCEWSMWQFTGHGSCPGISGNVDMNWVVERSM